MTAERELVIYRVAQESLTNVARHAGARRVALRLASDGRGGVLLVVRDDGRGLPADAEHRATGIRGMRERAHLGPRAMYSPSAPVRRDAVTVLIVDDHSALRAGLERLLAAEPGIVPLGAVSDERELIAALERGRPDVVVLDYALERGDG